MKALHCDREGCDSWQRQPAVSFLTLRGGYGDDNHFCTLDCCMHWCAAHSSPTEVITA